VVPNLKEGAHSKIKTSPWDVLEITNTGAGAYRWAADGACGCFRTWLPVVKLAAIQAVVVKPWRLPHFFCTISKATKSLKPGR
jgi:hypothetical protein